MKEKRALRPDGSPEARPARETKRIKHSKDADSSLAVVSKHGHSKISAQAQSSSPKKASSKRVKASRAPASAELSVMPKEVEEQGLAQNGRSDSWGLSYRSGGRFLNLDPIFSSDEKYLLLARHNAVQVYSMATSSIVRTLQIPDDVQHITGYKLCPVTPSRIFVATRSGSIIEWDWTTGECIHSWDISKRIVSLDAIPETRDDSSLSVSPAVYTICKIHRGKSEICVNIRERDTDGPLWKQSVIYKTSTHINNLHVVANGRVILATAGPYVVVGQSSGDPLQPAGNLEYTWREIRLPVYGTCFDIREPPQPHKLPAKAHNRLSPTAAVDLVVGDSDGAISIYYDFLDTLLRCENKGELDAGLVSRRLHWHRECVKTVRWSKDGNYLISGGLETVLVLWQLDTGRKQFLPHLTSAICNLVVSPSGVSYAVKLADNSAMVLSTSELRPTTSISSLQLPSKDDVKLHDKSTRSSNKMFNDRLAAVLHPIQSDYLLLAVPSSQAVYSPDKSPSASFLQTFDTRSNQHISRQALARTNVSILHTGPEGTELTTPEVKFVEISSDGDWLVTVDEWEQYPESMGVLTPIDESDGSCKRKEIFLKFWHWNETNNEWELVTRVDGPHFSSTEGSMPVRDLAVNPKQLGFATIGDDGVVRFWTPGYKPSSRKQDRIVKTWRCSRSIALESPVGADTASASYAGSCLGFSEDGSALAVCFAGQSNPAGLVYIIEPESGKICHTREGLFSGIPRGCGFLDRYLIVLSDHLVSWHTVTDQVMFAFALTDKPGSRASNRSTPLLALNHRNQTLAITFPRVMDDSETKSSESENKSHFQVAVFEPSGPNPLFQSKLKYAPRALLPSAKSGDYIVVDSAAQVLQLSSSTQLARVPIESSEVDLSLRTGLEDIFGYRRVLPQQNQSELDAEYEHVQVNSLADIFDVGPSFALPGVDVLLKDVMDMFGGKATKE
ncbi:WD repeat protein [Coccidioides immitis RS]|uniref:WD repeat protein n=1 Tax=Coccidioides immitis (strain RS) TaxID=246410 RepID=J3KFU0_COCIM|nr:WD repeat protein [Coccidioides immitis RS]EAS34523.3 WD repeat protein [Coccidioides immitis RS]